MNFQIATKIYNVILLAFIPFCVYLIFFSFCLLFAFLLTMELKMTTIMKLFEVFLFQVFEYLES